MEITNPLVAIRAGGTRRPWFCVHPVGGHVNEYARLAELLPAEQPVWGLCSRGLLDARAEHATANALVADYASVIATAHPGPYRLLGWSMGGLVAHALACELEARGHEVERVGMIDPPSRVVPVGGAEALGLALGMALAIFHPAPPPRPVIREAVRALAGRTPDGSLAAWCVAQGLLPAEGISHAGFDAAAALLPIHHALLAQLRPGICRAPLHVWRARALAGLAATDWSAHTTGGCTTTIAGGDHFTIMRPPHVATIAADLDALG